MVPNLKLCNKANSLDFVPIYSLPSLIGNNSSVFGLYFHYFFLKI